MTDSRQIELENVYTRSLIEAALERWKSLTREELKEVVLKHGVGSFRFKLAMTYLNQNKVIWKVGNKWELRTETAVL